MISFSELLGKAAYNHAIDDATVKLSLFGGPTLSLKFGQNEKILKMGYEGALNPWLSSLCYLVLDQGIDPELILRSGRQTWEKLFSEDQLFWDLHQESQDEIFFPELELFKAALDVYRGKDFLYSPSDPLICRCFGVRESDVLAHLREEKSPTLETLATKTKAGLGCRTCLTQLRRWFPTSGPGPSRYYKSKARVDWILEIHEALKDFPSAREWGMEVVEFTGSQVLITYEGEVPPHQLDEASINLQRFLASVVDPELGFFLIRARQRS